jgi:carbon-monoxide dehydrogenase small subunit
MGVRQITVRINGRTYAGQAEARKTLADFIREDCGLTGTHLGARRKSLPLHRISEHREGRRRCGGDAGRRDGGRAGRGDGRR